MKIVLIFILKGIMFWIILSFLIFILTAILLAVGGTKVYGFNYPNGQIKYRGYLKRCRDLVGLEKKYHENGNIKSKIRWKKNEMKSALFYYENGNLKTSIAYKNGKIDVGILNFYENGNLKSKMLYKNGVPEKFFKIYDKNKEVEEKVEKVELFYPNGNIESRSYFIVNKNVETVYQDGPDEKYYENGNLKSRVVFINGKVNGLMESYYENGNLESRIPFEDDEPLGIAEAYHENGNLKSKYYIDRLHMEYICCWCEDGKENKMLNLYNEKIKEIKEMYRKF